MFRYRALLCGAIGAALLLTGCGTQESALNPGSAPVTVSDVTEETTESAAQTTAETKQSNTTKTTTETKATSESTAETGSSRSTKTETEDTAPTGTSATETAGTGSSTAAPGSSQTETLPTTAPTTSVSQATAADPGTTAPEETTQPQSIPVPPADYARSAEQDALLNNTVFVGDSIISMMYKNGTLPQEQTIAVAGIGVRNVFETIFEAGGQECGVLDALRIKARENVICSFGLNDIRLLSEEEFTALYTQLLEKIQETLPEAKVWLLTITPVREDINFADNAYIDRYNDALRKMAENDPDWTLIDVAPELKSAANELKTEYDNGDGMHLSPAAYAPFLWKITDRMQAYAAEQAQSTE